MAFGILAIWQFGRNKGVLVLLTYPYIKLNLKKYVYNCEIGD